jgi:hypothetical protein
MFYKTSPQSTLLELDVLFPGLLPKNDWSIIYRDEVYPLIDEEAFRHLYCEDNGAPNKSIKLLVSLLIFMGMEVLTWRGAKDQFYRRIDWHVATYTVPGSVNIDHTTLFKFYGRLENDPVTMKMFCDLTAVFIEKCDTDTAKQRTDTFFIHGWLRTLSRFGLFKETIRVFLQNLRKQKPGLYDRIKGELSQDYLEKKFDLTEKDKKKAHRKIKKMARDLYLLKTTFETHKQVKHYTSFKTLLTVFGQQCEVVDPVETDPEIIVRDRPESNESDTPTPAPAAGSEGQTDPEIIIRKKPEGDDIICTPHNIDARYVRKGEQKVTGSKALVSETCGDNRTQFITDANVIEATASDKSELPNSLARRKAAGFEPDQELTDAAFNSGENILMAQDMGIELHGPTPGRSQSPATFAKPDRPLDAADFDIDIETRVDGEADGVTTRTLTVKACPEGHSPIDQEYREKSGHYLVHMCSDTCGGCPLKGNRCPAKIQKKTVSLTFTVAEVIGARQHRRFMTDPDYRLDYRPRAGAEGTVSELTRAHGMRESRHRGNDRTLLQMIFSSLACNVKRFIRHGQSYGYEPAPTG